MEEKGKKLTCVFCGKLTYQFCALCGSAMQKYPQDNGATACLFHCYNTGCFGLAPDDKKITNKKIKVKTYPTMAEMKANEQQMMQLSKQVCKGNAKNGGNNNSNGNNSSNISSDSDSDSQVCFQSNAACCRLVIPGSTQGEPMYLYSIVIVSIVVLTFVCVDNDDGYDVSNLWLW
jgi:hypothetical protein